MSCAVVTLTDAEIRRQSSSDAVRDIRDPRHQGLYFRFNTNRERGSWYLVVSKKWNKIAGYPELNTKSVLAVLPEVRQRFSADGAASATVSKWSTTGQLLAWYSDRMGRDRNLSSKRKNTSKSAIACHLIPRLGDMLLADIRHATLDSQLMWPLQETLSLEYVRLVFGLLVVACRQAMALNLIASNPMDGIKFSDFSKTKIKAKPARLRGVQLESLLTTLTSVMRLAPADAMLALMMLCHGTRVGETRMARWSHISLAERVWFIPAEHTKTRVEHSLPLTDQACALLTQYRDNQTAQGYDGQYVFPARNGKAMSEGQGCAVFSRLGQGEWTSHDLRKLARTGWADLGVDFLIGEMLVNHAMGHNVQAYIHTQIEQGKREALEKWHAHLDSKGFTVIHGLTEGESGNSKKLLQATEHMALSALQESTIGEV